MCSGLFLGYLFDPTSCYLRLIDYNLVQCLSFVGLCNGGIDLNFSSISVIIMIMIIIMWLYLNDFL